MIFEVERQPGREQDDLALTAERQSELEKSDGFLSVERFASLSHEGQWVSLSFWRDEEAVRQWNAQADPQAARQQAEVTECRMIQVGYPKTTARP